MKEPKGDTCSEPERPRRGHTVVTSPRSLCPLGDVGDAFVAAAEKEHISYYSSFGKFSQNEMGMVYFTRTALPLCMPGFHFGMLLMTRSAS